MDTKRDVPIAVGSRKQLLFDDLFLERSKGVTLRMDPPFQDPEAVLVADRPWEQMGLGAYNTIMLEDGTFRMWYDASGSQSGGQRRRFLCYAESEDGVRWQKPDLGLIPFDDSQDTNIVAPTAPNASLQGGTVFRDDRAPASERYKLWTKYQASEEEAARGSGRACGRWSPRTDCGGSFSTGATR